MGTNMLSARKVKLHGLEDVRWKVTDHMSQYRGLVKLFQRDRKIIDVDLKLSSKRIKKETKQLLKDIVSARQELENSSWSGDRQQVRNLLSRDKTLKMAYGNLHISKILDHIYQDNFKSRKMLDLLAYKMKMKADNLIKRTLERGDLEMQIEFEVSKKTPLDIQIGIITGRVQGMILKKEAAITVKATYMLIIDFMAKDAIYYDAMLGTLKKDLMAQCHCLMQATKLGQLATEYLDDRKVEYVTLQKVIKADNKMRAKDIENIRFQITNTVNHLEGLVRRDSDLTVTALPAPMTSTRFVSLNNSIEGLVKLFKFLQRTVMVSNFDCILPCLTAQEEQSVRLKELGAKCLENMERLKNRKQHAELIMMKMKNSVVENTLSYMSEKKRLKTQIDQVKVFLDGHLSQNARFLKKLVQIRMAVQVLELQCKVVSKPTTDNILAAKSHACVIEKQGQESIAVLLQKLQVLTSPKILDDLEVTVGSKELQMYAQLRARDVGAKPVFMVEEEFEQDIYMADGSVPTRNDIKEDSRQLVAYYKSMEIA